MERNSGLSSIILVLGKQWLVLTAVFALIFWGIGWLDGWLGLGVPGEVRALACFVVWLAMALAAVASRLPRGDDAAGLRLGLATFCRTGIPLLHVLVIMFNYPPEISEAAMGYIAICYLIGFPLSIALSLGDFSSSG